jgi:PelA/Pel-15E family pectate lyase
MQNHLFRQRLLPVLSLSLAFVLTVPSLLGATVVGTSVAAPSLTQERVNKLPAKERAVWTAYLERSHQQEMRDRGSLDAERKGQTTIPPVPQEGFGGGRSMPLDRDLSWYATPEARHVGDVIVSFQTPGGGWSKNFPMNGAPRLPGQSYAANNISRYLGPDDFDTPRDKDWNYISTLDNDATSTEIRFLALVATANPGPEGTPYRAACLRGIHYLLDAQFPNGGWPQVWPLEGGYHDAITFNDNAVTLAATVLTDAASGTGNYAFVPAELRRQTAAASARSLDCILKTQIVINGKRTVWAQQHDALTLAPVSGRNFEPAALSASESADVLLYLMSLPNPSPAVQASITAGVEWLKSAAIYGQAFTGTRAEGRHLVSTAGAGPIWSRYYSLTTGKPIFGDRDKTIHDDEAELSLERRNGYAWYSNGEQQAINAYADWSKTNAATH